MDYDAQEIANVFGRAARAYDAVIPFFAEFGARLVALADLQERETVLDLGCGRGATLLPAAERVGPSGRVLGVDLSEKMVALLSDDIRQRGLANAAARRMDAEALQLDDNSFDVALSSFVLHLLPHPELAAAELRRVIRSTGRVAASAPTGAGTQWEFSMSLFRRFGPLATRSVPIPFRDGFDLAAALASAGFQVVQTIEEQIEFVLADEQAWWEWAWSHGMRGLFETLSSGDLDDLRREVFKQLAALRTPEGVPMPQAATFVVAQLPS